jgi:hypothetical protein
VVCSLPRGGEHAAGGVAGGGSGGRHSRAVQVHSIKPTLKVTGTKLLKLKHDKLLSILLQFCIQIQLAPLRHGQDRRALPRVPGRLGGGACFLFSA